MRQAAIKSKIEIQTPKHKNQKRKNIVKYFLI
jgi:hypothetical protein